MHGPAEARDAHPLTIRIGPHGPGAGSDCRCCRNRFDVGALRLVRPATGASAGKGGSCALASAGATGRLQCLSRLSRRIAERHETGRAFADRRAGRGRGRPEFDHRAGTSERATGDVGEQPQQHRWLQTRPVPSRAKFGSAASSRGTATPNRRASARTSRQTARGSSASGSECASKFARTGTK
jgi:hypothetical protein